METVAKTVEKAADAVPDVITKNIPVPSQLVPAQRQDRQDEPGVEAEMSPAPEYIKPNYKGSGKLSGKVALITGGDSGIGRAVAVHFAREGAVGIVIVHKTSEENVDASRTVRLCEAEGCSCLSLESDIGDPEACARMVNLTIKDFGRLDILVNNAGEQHFQHSILDITPEQLQRTFATNIFSNFYLVKAALPHLKPGSSIINTSSVVTYKGEPHLLDYTASKACQVSFTRSLSLQLASKGIRVNAVAPGPIWTPLIPATFPKAAQLAWQTSALINRPGQPSEVAPAYVFLASADGSFYSGQVLHPNGGIPVSS